jgi:uncharacterized membrane protein YdjX (TVP38/TMEM64 family)
VLVVAGIVVVVTLVAQSGVIDHVRDEDELRATVDDAGVFGPLLFLGLMIVLVPLNVPGVLFVIPSTSLFGVVGGVALSLVGGFIASAIGVAVARHLGRPVFESRLPPRIRRLEERLSRHGFWGVVVARLVLYLDQPIDWLCGLSSIPMRTVLTATFVGLVPPTLVWALGAGSILELI